MATSDFNPNRLKFQACTERLQRAVKAAGLKTDGQIITSKDDGASELRKTLSTKNVPKGFHKWQLPVHLDNPSHLFITVAEPNSHRDIPQRRRRYSLRCGRFDHLRRKRTWCWRLDVHSGGQRVFISSRPIRRRDVLLLRVLMCLTKGLV